MRSITLLTAHNICVHQDNLASINHSFPCSDCPITYICTLFNWTPINWTETDIQAIENDSKKYYDNYIKR